MLCFRDATYCGSPGCKNECGRKMDEKTKQMAAKSGLPISYGYFCSNPCKHEWESGSFLVTSCKLCGETNDD